MFLMRNGVTRKGHIAYFRKAFRDPSQRLYAILSNGVHIGNCGFKNISPDGRKGELWIYIGDPSMRGKGAGREATRLLIQEGFERIGLKTICLHVADFNLAAQRMYLRFGFVEAPAEGGSSEWTDRDCRVIRMELGR
jgi:RimJ/RimL family protein N-acetyltransferase